MIVNGALRLARLAALLLVALCVRAQHVQYSFDYYGQEHGLASSLVRCLTQDSTGFLWVGTPIGLFRWDGFRFRQYTKDDGLPDNNIRAIHAGREGNLLVGTHSGIAQLDGNRFVMVSQRDLQLSSRTGFSSDRAGNVYAASRRGIHVRRPNAQFMPLPIQASIDTSDIPGMWAEQSGVIWFGCRNSICRWDGSRLDTFGPESGVPPDTYAGFTRDQSGNLLARGQQGVLIRAGNETRFRLDHNVSGQGSLQLLAATGGRIFVPSWDGLHIRAANGSWSQITEDNGLPASRINALWQDHEGALWFGFSDFGIARWRGHGDWQNWTRSNGLPSNVVSAVLKTADGSIWAGSRHGLAKTQSGSDQRFSRFPGLPFESVRSLAETPDGWLWVASHDGGLVRIHIRSLAVQRIGPANGLPATQIIGLYSDPLGSIWVTTRDGLYSAALHTPLKFERRFDSVLDPAEQIYAISRDGRGRLWLAGTQGLHLYEFGAWSYFGQDRGLRHRMLAFLAVSPAGNDVWVGYGRYHGISRLRWVNGQLQITHYDKTSSLASNDISFLSLDSRGWLWTGTDNGVDVFNGSTWRHIGSHDGLVWHDTVFNSFFAEPSGIVWIGTNRGLSRHQPGETVFDRSPPSVAITGVHSGEKLIDHRVRFELPFLSPFLRIGFTTLSFSQAAEARFRYRLKGVDNTWIDTPEREAVFAGLTPGDHEFEVQAGSTSGWNPSSAVVRFSILSPWYRTSGFFSVAAVLTGLFAFALHQKRVVRIQQQRQLLETAVQERTLQLKEEKNRTECEKLTVEQQKCEIERLLQKAREASRLKGEFLANMSHEIRTPMNGILGMTSLALHTDLRADQRDYIECAKASAEALLVLLNDILDFSKIEANRLELESLPFSPRAAAEDCIRTVRPMAGAKPIKVDAMVAPDVPDQVIGDPTRLRQILLNLLSNAVKFTPQGFVSLHLTVDSATASAVVLQFRVIDTGEGIAPAKHQLIFEAFRQADGSTTRRFGGTGLGLAICSSLVELMQGEIRVESELGRGSEFRLRIPFRSCSPDVKPDTAAPTASLGKLAGALRIREAAKSLRVLVAEDNLINQKLVVRMLERQGHEVEVAGDGKQAFALTAHKHFDLLLMDVQMPELDGLETARLIREREAGAGGGRIPILMLTANAMPGDKEKCLSAGADSYLAKPVSYDRLLAAVLDLTAAQPEV